MGQTLRTIAAVEGGGKWDIWGVLVWGIPVWCVLEVWGSMCSSRVGSGRSSSSSSSIVPVGSSPFPPNPNGTDDPPPPAPPVGCFWRRSSSYQPRKVPSGIWNCLAISGSLEPLSCNVERTVCLCFFVYRCRFNFGAFGSLLRFGCCVSHRNSGKPEAAALAYSSLLVSNSDQNNHSNT